MPTLRDHSRSKAFRAIGIGDSGTGKTGSLVEVINNMEVLGLQRVIIADFDAGTDILAHLVKPDKLDSVFVETFRDKLKMDMDVGANIATGSALEASWARLVRFMSNWPGVGAISKLDTTSLFVVDSITGLGDSNMNYAIGFGPEKGDSWRATGTGMRLQDKFIQLCIALECHFVLFSHIRFMGGGGRKVVEDKKGSKYTVEVDSASEGQAYPSALGKILPTTVARHFNTMIEYKLIGRNRRIRTVPEDRFALKCPIAMPEELPQDSGLFTVMKMFLGK